MYQEWDSTWCRIEASLNAERKNEGQFLTKKERFCGRSLLQKCCGIIVFFVAVGMDPSFLRDLPQRVQSFPGVGLCQPQGAAVLVDFEAHAVAVDLRDPAELREFLRKPSQPLLEVRVVGGDLHDGIRLVEIDLRKFLLFVQNASPP